MSTRFTQERSFVFGSKANTPDIEYGSKTKLNITESLTDDAVHRKKPSVLLSNVIRGVDGRGRSFALVRQNSVETLVHLGVVSDNESTHARKFSLYHS